MLKFFGVVVVAGFGFAIGEMLAIRLVKSLSGVRDAFWRGYLRSRGGSEE